MSDSKQDYLRVLAGVTGILGLKLLLTHVLTVRSRLIQREFKVPEDGNAKGPALAVFKAVLCAHGAPVEIKRLLGVVSNSVENEPQLLFMGLMLGLTGHATANDALLLKAYASLRIVHFISYLLALQPFRALSYVGGLLVNLCFGARLMLLLL
eukprot:TRINITY_DN4512_c0_g1_i1.p1 TRINITY_DN4512_c0_g1~~TRINITY_DN4512_c0_g1_i1.p1  ORF type:complete len:176 (+),score=72.03 TRINITY_DN4512_c0_g1_i1:72-530(+)